MDIRQTRGNTALAAEEREKAVRKYSVPLLFSTVPNRPCCAAAVFERAAHRADADRALAAVGKLRLVDCYRFRADILDDRRDWPGSEQAYADAVALTALKHAPNWAALKEARDASAKHAKWTAPSGLFGSRARHSAGPQELRTEELKKS